MLVNFNLLFDYFNFLIIFDDYLSLTLNVYKLIKKGL
jgi:hypothetical protein